MLKVGSTHCHFKWTFGDEESLRKIKECGFDSVDFTFNSYQDDENFILEQSEEKIEEYFTRIKKLADGLGLEIGQTHAPGYYGKDFYEHPEILMREKYKNIFINSIKATKYLGCKYIVIHPLVLPDHENTFFKNVDLNVSYFGMFKPVIKETGVTVAIENMDGLNPLKKTGVPTACSSGEKINYLISKLGEGFCACLDTGHAYLSGNEPCRMAEVLGDNLKVIHLQDSDGYDDIHVPPTCSYVDWDGLLRALAKINFQGMLDFEVDYHRTSRDGDVMMAEGRFLCALGKEFARKIERYKTDSQSNA